MRKLLMQYLWLSIILLGGYGQTYAHQNAAIATSSSKSDISKQEQDGLNSFSLRNSAAVINYTAVHFEKQQETIEISQNENEEEELSLHSIPFFKKHTVLNKYLSSYYAEVPGLSHKSLAKCVPSGRPFHSLSSRQYILFRVIRI
jgi:hypothetical protein